MNRFISFGIFPFLLVISASAAVPVHSNIAYDRDNPTNGILLTWEAIPTKQYNVMTTPALGQQPWQALNPAPVYASNNWVQFRDTNLPSARFYKVVKLDTDAPQIWRLAPGSNAIAVGLQSPLKAWLQDETAIDPISIRLSVGTNPPVTLADPRLGFTNNALTYTPATNEFLGTNAQSVSALLVMADTLGHWVTNSWSFQLELESIVSTNAVLIGGGGSLAAKPGAVLSGLTLISTNGDTYVFSYTGPSSGLSTGQVLVSTDASLPYKRKILSLIDDTGAQTVSCLTTQACLAECVQQGSIRLTGDFSQSPGGGTAQAGPVAAGVSATIPLDGTVIYDNGTIRVEITSGQITFDPDFTVSGEFQNKRLVSFDSEISGTVGLDMTLQGSFQATGDWDGSRPLITPRRSFKVLAWIGFVPVWVETVLEFDIGYEAHAEGQGTATWGFTSSRTLTFGARLRDGQWSKFAQQNSSFNPFTPGWEINGAATVKGYVEPKLTVYLESLVGPSADLKPYLEIEGNACVQPGQAGVDLSLYAGLSSTLAIEVRGWDEEWGSLPSWELFNLRALLWHNNVSTPIGPAPQTFGNMVWIPCGTFTMGSPDSEPARYSSEGPQTRVTRTHGFWMGKYEVRQGEYLAVMGNNPSWFTGDLSRPVEQVTWYDTTNYCYQLTLREQAAGRLPAGYVYRLPTEAEWEYACRAGTTTAFHYGPALRSGMANFYGYYEYPPCGSSTWYCYNPSGTYLGRTTLVGSYAPNAWGLYDMHGNVWEWCQDWWSSSLPGGSVTDPQGPPTGSYRVIRGGGWGRGAGGCRAASRDYDWPGFWSVVIGFRVVLAPGQP